MFLLQMEVGPSLELPSGTCSLSCDGDLLPLVVTGELGRFPSSSFRVVVGSWGFLLSCIRGLRLPPELRQGTRGSSSGLARARGKGT